MQQHRRFVRERLGGNVSNEDINSLGLLRAHAQTRNKWRRKIGGGGNQLTQVHVEKWPLKLNASTKHSSYCAGESDCRGRSRVHWTFAEHWRLRRCRQVGPRQSQHVPDEFSVQDAQGLVALATRPQQTLTCADKLTYSRRLTAGMLAVQFAITLVGVYTHWFTSSLM